MFTIRTLKMAQLDKWNHRKGKNKKELKKTKRKKLHDFNVSKFKNEKPQK